MLSISIAGRISTPPERSQSRASCARLECCGSVISGNPSMSRGVIDRRHVDAALRQDRHEVHVADMGRLEQTAVHRQPGEAEVDQVARQALDDLRRIAGADDQLDRRVLAPEPLQHRQEKVAERRVADTDPHPAEAAVPVPPDDRERAPRGLEDVAGMVGELAPGRGRRRLPPGPAQQRHAEARFELADLEAHGRLGEVEPLGRGRDAAELDDLDERLQLVEVEIAHRGPPVVARTRSMAIGRRGARAVTSFTPAG